MGDVASAEDDSLKQSGGGLDLGQRDVQGGDRKNRPVLLDRRDECLAEAAESVNAFLGLRQMLMEISSYWRSGWK